ncbi:MAG: HNH endonuclease signature motif containing protein [Ilumatobacteraceae bacterium]
MDVAGVVERVVDGPVLLGDVDLDALCDAELDEALDHWRQRADAELNHDGPEPKLPAPSLTLIPIQGAVTVDGELDPVGGQIVINALDAIAVELALDAPLPERRAAALVEMARRAMVVPVHGRPARILANVAIGHDSFAHLRELSNGTVIRPGHLVPYLDALDVRSILFDSATHAVATSTRRTFTGALRAVIEVRDRHCQHASGCDEPIDGCDVDHVVPSSYGGGTSQDNGWLLCAFHNRIESHYARPPTAAWPFSVLNSWIAKVAP